MVTGLVKMYFSLTDHAVPSTYILYVQSIKQHFFSKYLTQMKLTVSLGGRGQTYHTYVCIDVQDSIP